MKLHGTSPWHLSEFSHRSQWDLLESSEVVCRLGNNPPMRRRDSSSTSEVEGRSNMNKSTGSRQSLLLCLISLGVDWFKCAGRVLSHARQRFWQRLRPCRIKRFGSVRFQLLSTGCLSAGATSNKPFKSRCTLRLKPVAATVCHVMYVNNDRC